MLKTRRSSSSATPFAASQPKTSGRSQDARVDNGAEARRQHAREIARDAATGDMGQPADVGAGTQRADVVKVETRRREQQIGIERVVADDAADEREPVGMNPGGGEADHDVAGRDA